MNCQEVQAFLDGLILADPEQECSAALREHVAACEQCRRDYEAARKTLVLLRSSESAGSTTALRENIMKKIEVADGSVSSGRLGLWPKRHWKPLLGGVLVAVGVLLVMGVPLFFRSTATPVYAIEKAVKAAQGLRTIHVRMTPAPFGTAGEIWARFDEKGGLVKVRMNFLDTEDGPKDVILEGGQAQVWFKKKGSCVLVKEPAALERLKLDYDRSDPRHALDSARQSPDQAETRVVSQKPAADGGVIEVTVTDKRAPGGKEVYRIDPKTDLPVSKEVYEMKDGVLALAKTIEFVDANKPFDESVFSFMLPQGTIQIDQTQPTVGLAQGDLGDNEVAVQVVREFLTAMVEQDFAKVGQLWGGIPAADTKKQFSGIKIVRIVSIGTPVPHEKTRALQVPCKFEVEFSSGQKSEKEAGPLVRKVHGQSGRWCLIGGF